MDELMNDTMQLFSQPSEGVRPLIIPDLNEILDT